MSTAYRLLVVEDEEPIAELLEYGLRQEGYTVRVALTGGDAMRLAAQEPPDLILLDWMLPDCSGLDLCRFFTEKYNRPLILLTARSHMDDKVQGLESGADDYVTKPFEMRELLARVHSVLRRAENIPARSRRSSCRAGCRCQPRSAPCCWEGSRWS